MAAEENPTAPPRRRERARPARAGARVGAQAHIGRVRNPWAPLEIYSPEQVEAIIEAGWRILEEAGLEIRSAAAREIYRRAGALVDEETQVVRIGRDIARAALAHAPERFVLHARNPERDLHVGGDVVNFGPVGGAPHVTDIERGRRYGDIAALRDIVKTTHALGVLHWQGGFVVEPVDLPVATRHLDVYRAHIELSDLVWTARGLGRAPAEDGVAMCAIEHGLTLDELGRRPSLMIITNVNSPRRVDEEILDNVMIMARHGQCVAITPFTLMGAMAPVTLPGALAQQTAEALGVLTLVQLVRPGCPSVFGGFTSNVDMRTGAPAFGTPEYAQAVIGGGQIARRLRLPYRTSAPNASNSVDAQATYETFFSLFAAVMSHGHLIAHAAGWLEGGLSASMEKIVVDAEMLREWAALLKPAEFSAEALALEAIKGVPPGGHFFGEAHTLARYENAFWRPILSDWSNFENWRDAGARDATQRAALLWRRLCAEHQPPPLDPAIAEALDAYVARRKEKPETGP